MGRLLIRSILVCLFPMTLFSAPGIAANTESHEQTTPISYTLRQTYSTDFGGRYTRITYMIPRTPIDDDDLMALAAEIRRKSIYGLALGHHHITDRGIAHLEGLQSLMYLSIGGSRIGDQAMRSVATLNNLRFLKIRSDTNITDKGVAFLAELPDLRGLTLRNQSNITDDGIAHIANIPNLEALELIDLSVSDAGLRKLGKVETLEYLHLRELPDISDAGLAGLADLPSLVHLELRRLPNVNGSGLEPFARQNRLEYLIIRGTLSEEGFAGLAHLTNLKALSLYSTGITDAAMPNLARMTRLQWLNIFSGQVTDEGLQHLSELTSLHYLRLVGTPVTRRGVRSLRADLPNLEKVVGVRHSASEGPPRIASIFLLLILSLFLWFRLRKRRRSRSASTSAFG